MRIIVLQLARLLAAVLALYACVLALTLLLVPPQSQEPPLDTAQAVASLYLTEPKYLFMTRQRLNTSAEKVLVLGASNALVGFKQPEVQALLPNREVHNISISGSNITQLRQIVELVREVQTAEARRSSTYVLGLWYGVFADDRARWFTRERQAGDTDIDIERYRYGFYRRTERGAVPLLPTAALTAGILAIHPYLVLDQAARDLTQSLRQHLSGKPALLTDAQRNARVVSESERQQYLTFWRRYMGGVEHLSDRQFQELERIVDRIVVDGAHVVLVDLPIPRWHAEGSVLAADYATHMATLLPRLAQRRGVTVLRLANADANSDDDFSDEVHPKPRVTPRWAIALAETLTTPAPEPSNHEYRSSLH